MSVEPPLPAEFSSTLRDARDLLVAELEHWGSDALNAEVIGHSGKVTRRFLAEQHGRSPRAIVTALRAANERIGGGKQTEFVVRWGVFVVVGGTLEDRATKSLDLCGELVRLVTESPWMEAEGSPFTRKPIAESVSMDSLYEVEDEEIGESIWLVNWRQSINLGPSSRSGGDDEPLTLIDGTSDLGGSPNTGSIETEVT